MIISNFTGHIETQSCSECLTLRSIPCKFPFIDIEDATTHYSCETAIWRGRNWCATETDENGKFIDGRHRWGYCNMDCELCNAINDTMEGFIEVSEERETQYEGSGDADNTEVSEERETEHEGFGDTDNTEVSGDPDTIEGSGDTATIEGSGDTDTTISSEDEDIIEGSGYVDTIEGSWDTVTIGQCVVNVSAKYHIAGTRYFLPVNVLTKTSPEIRDPPNFWKPPGREGPGGILTMDLGCPRLANTLEVVNMHNGDGRETATKKFQVSVKKEESDEWKEVVKRELWDCRDQEDPLPIVYSYFPLQGIRFIKFEILEVWGKNRGGLQYLNMSFTGKVTQIS